MNDQSRDLLDYDNRERTENLSQKVALLKNYAIDIEEETKKHNRYLDEVVCHSPHSNRNSRSR